MLQEEGEGWEGCNGLCTSTLPFTSFRGLRKWPCFSWVSHQGELLTYLPLQNKTILCAYRALTKESRQESVQQRRKKGCFFPVTGWRSSSFQTNWRGGHGQRQTPETYTSEDRLGWLHHTLNNLKPHRLRCFQKVVFYYRTSRSWHFWPNCFKSKSIPSHTPVLTQPVTQMYSWQEVRSEHAILTDTQPASAKAQGGN